MTTARRRLGVPSPGQPSAGAAALRAIVVATGFSLLAAVAVGVWRHWDPGTDGLHNQMSGWLLAAMFFAAQITPLHMQRGRETRSVTLSELPFVLGLLFVSPLAFVLARTVGGGLVTAIRQRQYRNPVKLVFNLVLFFDEAVIGVALFHLLDTAQTADSLWAWVAVVAATIASNILAALAVATLIELIEGRAGVRRFRDVLVQSVPQSLVVSILGLDVAIAATASDWAFVPLAAGLLLLLISYRAYSRLAERHSLLELLYGFTGELASGLESGSVVSALLEQCTLILHADHARLVYLDPADGAIRSESRVTAAGAVDHEQRNWLADGDRWLLAHVVDRGHPLLVPRETPDDSARVWLDRNGLRDAVLAPVRLGSTNDAILVVADRMGDARTFNSGDLRLLEALAAQASVSLGNGRLVEQLRYSSLHDAVTDLPNRTFLEQTLAEQLSTPDRGELALAMIGLDAIKEVNDAFGHHHGDAIVQEVARRLIESVGDTGTVARFGGAELAVVIPRCPSVEAVRARVAGILEPLTEPIVVEDTAIDVGPCAGIAFAPRHAANHVDLIKCSDVAMYSAKTNGVDVAVYDPENDPSSKERLALVAALRQAIAADVLSIDVQPKTVAADGRLVSVEALARWRDPELGVVPPNDFIPIAEHSGLIRQLTEAILGQSLAACAAWQSVAPGVGVAVNISARLLHQGELDSQIVRLLRRYDLPASLLTLELTESSLMTDAARTSDMLHRLRRLGTELSVDDFGTGYSSLAYLQQLPVTEVKIDQTFIRRMRDDGSDAKIVQAIVQLGHALGLVVVAEGVEDGLTLQALDAIGVDVVQGYHVARPMPVADFPRWCTDYLTNPSRRLSAV